MQARLKPVVRDLLAGGRPSRSIWSSVPACAQDLLADSNPMVVANAVAALAEVHEVGGAAAFHITSTSLFKLLRALNECTEWGQVPRPGRPAGRVEPPCTCQHRVGPGAVRGA